MVRSIVLFVIYAAAYFLSQFYRSATAVLSPELSSELLLSAADLGLVTSLFFATFALAQIPLGIGLDRWGPRWVTPGLMIAGVAGSLIFGMAQSLVALAVGRALLGIGMAGIMLGALKAFSRWYPPHRFATFSGLLVGIGSLGALMAATPLAWLSKTAGWRAVFCHGAWVIAVIALSIFLLTRNTPPGVEWESEKRTRGNLRAVFGDSRFWRISVHAFFMAGILGAFSGLWAGPYLFDVFHLTTIKAANVLLLLGLGTGIGFSFSGWLADRIGLTRVMLASSVFFLVCQLALALRPPLLLVRWLYLLFGFCGGFVIVLMAQARRIFSSAVMGQVLSIVNLFAFLGSFALQWAMGVVVEAFSGAARGSYAPRAYTTALLFTAIGTLVSLIWYLPLAREMPHTPSSAS